MSSHGAYATEVSTTVSSASVGETPCTGDCNGDNVVKVDELIVGVNLILLQAELAACPRFDANFDQRVTVDELVAAVTLLLNGCNS